MENSTRRSYSHMAMTMAEPIRKIDEEREWAHQYVNTQAYLHETSNYFISP